ncbi:MAG TPA: protein kinase [Pyrinomonadaceae bacterium]|nr:protein kinase [Pyrinomonadaceae bacterium]
MKLEILVGQTLDNKYKIERELGRGGMGTVYLATHVGTERPVAVKVIAPQFMEREEFVERFRREARAAGRLRHPNVVNVTDFGLSETKLGRVAYLVMEYLDGCTLGEILEEEKKMPFSWSIDILEQVCSAVHEAHSQGIIHRDLKPDNIWLEPNQRGGYTVKVLDFGIAKLEENVSKKTADNSANGFSGGARNLQSRQTVADNKQAITVSEKGNLTAVGEAATMALPLESKTLLAEAGTLIQSNEIDFEGGTAILPAAPQQIVLAEDNTGTKLMSAPFETNDSISGKTDESVTGKVLTSELTHVGAVLGTPLYMSPEQCRGEKLSPRSDIYSLAVIAYQMLSGKTPFAGDFESVMNAHKESAPPALDAKKVPKRVRKIIHASLAKNPGERPPTAEAFASEMRAQSEGIGTLLRRSLTIYSEHLPKFLSLAILLYLPFIMATVFKIIFDFLYVGSVIDGFTNSVIKPILILATTVIGIFCGCLLFGTTTWIVTQILAAPLRPVDLREALKATRRKLKTLFGTGTISTFLVFLGYALCFFPGLILSIAWALIAPVVMMENLRGRAAMKRSKMLVKRALPTTIAALSIMFLVPIFTAMMTTFLVNASVKSVSDFGEKFSNARVKKNNPNNENQSETKAEAVGGKETAAPVGEEKLDKQITINFGTTGSTETGAKDSDKKNVGSQIKTAVGEDLTAILLLPFQILMASFSSIIVALLYIKTRLVGGESMKDLLAQFEEADRPQSNWQKRIRRRVEQSGKQTGKL